jgi:hypothetical protein
MEPALRLTQASGCYQCAQIFVIVRKNVHVTAQQRLIHRQLQRG